MDKNTTSTGSALHPWQYKILWSPHLAGLVRQVEDLMEENEPGRYWATSGSLIIADGEFYQSMVWWTDPSAVVAEEDEDEAQP